MAERPGVRVGSQVKANTKPKASVAVWCAWSPEQAGREQRGMDIRLFSASLDGAVGMVWRERGLEDAARGQGP